MLRTSLMLILLCCLSSHVGAQPTNLNEIPNQLQVPDVVEGEPRAGIRVWQRLDAYRDWRLAHAIYLPPEWQPGSKYPVIFEYPGNGGFKNALGDVSAGTVDGCRLGYGLSQGREAIWVCLPLVDRERRQHSVQWWGDADETVRYCKQAVEHVCDQWGGDRQRLLLCGFSRGAIATSYIGLRDDEIASLWSGIMAHSHYDGVRKWAYNDSDTDSAIKRVTRFNSKPQWISHENSIAPTEEFLRKAGLLHDQVTLRALPFANHSADWLLKDIPLTQEARNWWRKLASKQ